MTRPIYIGDKSATGAPSQPAPGAAIQIAGIDANGNLRPLRTDELGAILTRGDVRLGDPYSGGRAALTWEVVAGGKFAYDLGRRWSVVASGSASGGYEAASSSYRGDVTGALGDGIYIVGDMPILYGRLGTRSRWTVRFSHPAQVGQVIEWGGIFDVAPALDAADRVGFIILDGLWAIYLRGESLPVNPQTIIIPQAFWQDPLDGTGPSGATITVADLVNETEYMIVAERKTVFFVGNIPVLTIDFGDPATSGTATLSRPSPVFRSYVRIANTANNGVPASAWMSAFYGEVLVGIATAPASPNPGYATRDPVSIPSGESRPIVALRAALSIAGATNGGRVLPEVFRATFGGEGQVEFYIGDEDAFALTGASFTPTADGIAEYDVSSTAVTISPALRPIRASPIVADESFVEVLSDLFNFERTLTVTGAGKRRTLLVRATNNDSGAVDFWMRQFTFGTVV